MTDAITSAKSFPSVYKWTTYGLTTAIEKIWKTSKEKVENHDRIDPLMVELCSVLERSLNYMHTGHAKVLATSVMAPMWTSQGLIDHGMPIFARMVRLGTSIADTISVDGANWPCDDNTQQPYSSSRRSQVMTYGEQHYMVRGTQSLRQTSGSAWCDIAQSYMW